MESVLLPLFIFYDDWEVGNPLGSHAGVNKFNAIYALIRCLPPNILLRLPSIIFSTFIYVSDKKQSTNKNVFAHLIKELNFLRREGISIIINGVKYVVKFQLTLIICDNLGLKAILGFVELFKSNHYCRFCRASSIQAATMTEEDESLLRTIENYQEGVKK